MTTAAHRGTEPPPAPPDGPGLTTVRGPAEDLQAQLFGPGSRPVAEGYTAPEKVSAAVQGARTSIQVHGGAGEGAAAVDTAALHTATTAVGRIAEDLGEVLVGLMPLTAELELWALTGQSLLGDAAATAEFLAGDLTGRIAHVGTTVGRLALAALRYEATEHVVLGMFSDAALNSPWHGPGATVAKEVVRTVEALDAALTRADITSPTDFAAKVRFSGLGVVVRGGGPDGTDAVVRGPGLDDVVDTVLQAPLSDARGAPGTGAGGTEPRGAAPSGGRREQDGAASPRTLGQFLRGWAVDTLRGYDGQSPAQGADTALGAAVTAALVSAAPLPVFFRPHAEGRLLPPAVRLDRGLRAALRPGLEPHALHPTRREVFTGLTPGNAADHHMTGLGQRPLPRGVDCDGAVPTTVAGTAAVLKDAKNIVSGAGPDGKAVENSTVVVQKATGGNGRAAYSVVLTGTEQWEDGPGVHDVKGIADAMTAPPTAALTELPQAQRMALQALRDAGIRPGDAVVLTGHSLGGIDAAGLAANREFRQLYDVQAVTTFGAPVGDFAIPDSTSVMAVEHVDDLVPPLDGVPNPDSAHRSTVRVDTPYPDSPDWKSSRGGTAAHEMYLYTLGAQGISAAEHPVVQAHEQRLAAAVPHGPGTRTETFVYEGVEEH